MKEDLFIFCETDYVRFKRIKNQEKGKETMYRGEFLRGKWGEQRRPRRCKRKEFSD